MKDCDICDRLRNGEGIELRGNLGIISCFKAFVNLENPETPGQMIIVPVKHVERIRDFTSLQRDSFMELLSPVCTYVDDPKFIQLYHHLQHHGKNKKEVEVALKMLNHPLAHKIPDDYEIRFRRGRLINCGKHWYADMIPIDD